MRTHPPIVFAIVITAMVITPALATEYWIAPDGDDHAAGTSRRQAWVSPSRGQPTRIHEGYKAGDMQLRVLSTEGFLDAGRIIVSGEQCAYTSKSGESFELAEPLSRDFGGLEYVNDATILGGDSFEPGDVISLVGGEYVDQPLHFCKSGREGQPITYRSVPGEKAVLVSQVYNVAPIKRLGSWKKDSTQHVVFKALGIDNHTDGRHGAAGLELYGIAHVLIKDCDIDISGHDINGDNNGIAISRANDVVIDRCRIRSRQANGVLVRGSSDILIQNSVIYESFNGIQAATGHSPAHVDVRNCTIYAINTYGAANAESPGTIGVENCIVAQAPTAQTPALRGTGSGDFNCVWHVPIPYGPDWNGSPQGTPGQHDISVDPQFISLDPGTPYFLHIPHNSPAAQGGRKGSHMGAFAPVAWPIKPKGKDFDVRDFGAVGDGVTDDLPAIREAIAQAKAAGGGRILFPPSHNPYLVSDTIHVDADHTHLIGPGATLKLKPGAGRMDLLRVGTCVDGARSGPVQPVIKHITVEGFTLDGSYHSQVQERVGNHPRGIWIGRATHVTVKDLMIRDTYCGLSFGPGARDGQAIDVTVTDWNHDGFAASGRGISGSCSDIRFIRCKAVNTPRCVKAWEIEEGAHRVYLEDCLIDNLGGSGTGYYVRHHAYRGPLLVHDVVFRRCRVRNISGQGFILTTVPGTSERSIRPAIETRNVHLLDCKSDAPVTIACGIDDVVIEGGRFDNLMAIGFEAMSPDEDRNPRWPARSVTIQHSVIDRLKVNATTGNPNANLGDDYWPDYEPRIRLTDVHLNHPAEITGNHANVVIEDRKIQKDAAISRPADSAELVLVEGGSPASTIVVADDADWWHRMAANWLQDYVQRATGATLSIVRERDAPGGTLICVGHTKRTREAGIHTDNLKWDGARLVVSGNVLFLVGRDGVDVGRGDPSTKDLQDWYEDDPWRPDRIGGTQGADLAGANGTCKAVVTFLEDICGVRWFMPVEQGIVVPRHLDLAVQRTLNKRVDPVFAYASGSFLYGTPRLYPSAYANNFRIGIRLKTYGGHAWYSWVHASLFDKHPEYFALRNGKRTAEGNHLCTTNLDVRDRMLGEICDLFDQGYDWVQIGQSDGWQHCECDQCEAMDNFKPYDPSVDGPDWYKWLHTTSRQNPVERIHVLHNWVAEQVAISHPGKKVHYLAYIPTRWPSKKIKTYSPNIVAELCHEIPEMLDAWSGKVSAMTIYKIWWDMSWVYGYGPNPTPKEVADEIRRLRDKGVIGIYNGGDANCWGLNGPVFYVMGKTIGDPDLNEIELVNEYCHGVYGDAGGQMIDFFQHLYRGPARRNKLLPDAPHGESLRARFPPRLISELEDLLKKAESVGVSGHAADNLRMTRIALDYLQLTTHMWLAYETFQVAHTPASLADLRKRVDAFEDFRHMILHMDPDDAQRRFPDWGHLCKWLVGSREHYWHSWYYAKHKEDLSLVRGTPVGFFAKIREPLTLDFNALETEMGHSVDPDAASLNE